MRVRALTRTASGARKSALQRAIDRADAPLARVYDQRKELVRLYDLGAFAAHRIAVGLRHPRPLRRRSSRPRSLELAAAVHEGAEKRDIAAVGHEAGA